MDELSARTGAEPLRASDLPRWIEQGAAILDIRSSEAFAAGHMPGSGHIPHADRIARLAELPPRGAPLLIVAESPDQAAAAARELAERGYTAVTWLDAAAGALDARDRAPAARLWRPAPFLEQVVAPIPRGLALDVAAGSGRDAVFLALAGFEVTACDRDAYSLDAAKALADRHHVTIATLVLDLEAEGATLPESRFALVTCFRFLHRPLFPAIEHAIAPGGFLVYETFRVGQERYGKPRRPQFLLEAGELARAFPALETLRYEEPSPEGGPLTARLLARRPG